jgi:nucleoside-diphosphate-sugar epimerase
VYGANSELVLNEGSWLNPVSLYARTRIQSEEMLLQHGDALGVVILRLSTVFGLSPRMRFDLLVNTLTMHAARNGKMQVFGGNQWRPLHVRTPPRPSSWRWKPLPKERGVFSVGANDSNYTIVDIANLVAISRGRWEVKGDVTDPDYRVSTRSAPSSGSTRFTVEDGIREIAEA